jgi:hypothetical protein
MRMTKSFWVPARVVCLILTVGCEEGPKYHPKDAGVGGLSGGGFGGVPSGGSGAVGGSLGVSGGKAGSATASGGALGTGGAFGGGGVSGVAGRGGTGTSGSPGAFGGTPGGLGANGGGTGAEGGARAASGGASGTGGSVGTGGTVGLGGAPATGGAIATGGRASNGGAVGTGGSGSGSGGIGGAPVCTNGATDTCAHALGALGTCAKGTTTCIAGNWGVCSIQKTAADTCTVGNDDNCNGSANEGCDCSGFPMPNPASAGLPNSAMYDTRVAGLVTDKVTGLMWQQNVPIGTYTQAQADAYCGATFKGFGGFSDWRLPTTLELVSIVDFTTASPATNAAVFPDSPNASVTEIFWTKTPYVGVSGFGWVVNYASGNTAALSSLPGYMYNARCVRGAVVVRCFPSGSRYAAQGGGVILDATTGLEWQAMPSSTAMSWTAATAYCSGLGGGFRVPSLNELQTIVDRTIASPGPLISAAAFPNTPAAYFWTSSRYFETNPDPSFPGYWIVDFKLGNTGGVSAWLDTDLWYVRCVR